MSELLTKVIEVYLDQGIVTRNDVANMDSRPGSKTLYRGLKESGYENAMITEINLDNYWDYSRVIYDPDRFTNKEVKEYMLKHVLNF